MVCMRPKLGNKKKLKTQDLFVHRKNKLSV